MALAEVFSYLRSTAREVCPHICFGVHKSYMKPLKIESGVQIPRKRFDWSTNCQIGENDWKSNLQEMINKLLLNVK